MTQNPQNLPATRSSSRIQPAAAYIASLRTDVSRRGQVSALNTVAQVILNPKKIDRHERALLWQRVDWTTLNAQNVRAIMAKVPGAPATRNKVLCALRGVARMAWESSLLDVETYQRIKDIRGDIGLRLAKGREIPQAEIARLLEACVRDTTPAGARDAAMIALMAGTGLRRAEVCALHSAGLNLAAGSFKVIGKRNKERTGYLSGGALAALQDWMAIRGSDSGPIFCAIGKNGVLKPGRALSTVTINRVLSRRAIEAGMEDVTPHDFRRTFISEMLDAGVDIVTVADTVGHEDVKTTQRYDRRGERTKQDAVKLINVPYNRHAQEPGKTKNPAI